MKTIFTIVTFVICLSAFSQNQNKAGTLDSSFGVNGKVITSSELGYLDITAATQRSDGSIIVAGDDESLDGFSGMLAMKYSPDGLLDSSFGNQGLAVVYGTGSGLAVAVQPDNKVILAGYGAELFGPHFVMIARLKANGSIDSSFGSNGFLSNLALEFGRAVTVQTDGKILVTGDHKGFATTLRYLPGGTLDASFGNNGVVETHVGSGTSVNYTILVQPDNKIVTAGTADGQTLIIRYNANGTLDETFGNSGIVRYNIGSGVDEVSGIALQRDNKIVAVGTSYNNNFPDTSNTIVLRYMPDGSLDKNFANNGLSLYKLQTNAFLKSVVLQKDEKIITAGGADNITGTTGHFLLERYNNDGTIDSAFSNDGYQITEMSYADLVDAVMLQKSGKIVVAGGADDTTTGPSSLKVALARYDNDETKKQIIINKIKHYIETHNNIQASTLNNVSIYPNPATNILHVEGLSSSQKIKLTVVDIAGNIKLQTIANASSYNLNIATLQAGNYLLKIEMNGEVIIKQFVKE